MSHAEWSDQYNPFNSLKVLAWREQFEALAQGEILPPVAVTIDPTNKCNLRCQWCLYDTWRHKNLVDADGPKMLRLPPFLKRWGVQAVCIAGGGEPTLHKDTTELIRSLFEHGIHTGMITNGTRISEDMLDAMQALDWVGVSVDAGTPETYAELKQCGSATFNQVMLNIASMTCLGLDVGFKYLIHPQNYREIVGAARMAKDLGCHYFHGRPVYLPGRAFSDDQIKAAWDNISVAREELEDGRFRVLGVGHKFSPTFTPNIPFKSCRIASIGGTVFAADGNIYLCCDNRGQRRVLFGSWEDLRMVQQLWGSDYHKKITDAIDVSQCGRCTYKEYGVILEEVFEKDKMNYHFV